MFVHNAAVLHHKICISMQIALLLLFRKKSEEMTPKFWSITYRSYSNAKSKSLKGDKHLNYEYFKKQKMQAPYSSLSR